MTESNSNVNLLAFHLLQWMHRCTSSIVDAWTHFTPAREQARPCMQQMSVIASFQKCSHCGSVMVRTQPRGSGRVRSTGQW